MDSIPPIVDEIAEIFAQHRVVPFIGAGCSVGHLRVDWDGLRDEMATAIGATDTDHAIVAGAYAHARGREALDRLLRDRLHVDAFDPSRGDIQLRLMGLNVPSMYTTNQDALVELCFAKHGRALSVVLDIDDVAALSPKDAILYKFHGDLSRPATIVFSDDDYVKRQPPSEHPLDIRLRSDALTKTFVFLGYSFRDANVRALFSQLQGQFRGKLPQSYLVQFSPNASFAEEMKTEFGVHAVSCHDAYAHRDLLRAVVQKKAALQIEERFKPRVPLSFPVATPTDVDAVGYTVAHAPVSDGIRAFRATFDAAVISEGLQERVSQQFATLCRNAAEEKDAVQLRGALFNLRLTEGGSAFEALSACYTLAHILPSHGTFETFMPHLHGFDADDGAARLLPIASAFMLLREWARPPTPRFYTWVTFMLHDPPPRASLPPETCRTLDSVFAEFYGSGRTTHEHPLNRGDRLARIPGRATLPAGNFERIRSGFMASMPKISPRPYHP